jgi:hypothetical protein
MLAADFYTSPAWDELRTQALLRDRFSCTVARLLGGACAGTLHVHHIVPVGEDESLALNLDNLATVCASHHPTWEALRRALLASQRSDLPPCGHRHPYPQGRIDCERRRRRERELAA